MAASEEDVFRALADGTRRTIIEVLDARGEQTLYGLCVVLVTDHGIDMTRQGVTKHLAILEDAGLVATRQQGRVKMIGLSGRDRLADARGWLDRFTEHDRR